MGKRTKRREADAKLAEVEKLQHTQIIHELESYFHRPCNYSCMSCLYRAYSYYKTGSVDDGYLTDDDLIEMSGHRFKRGWESKMTDVVPTPSHMHT